MRAQQHIAETIGEIEEAHREAARHAALAERMAEALARDDAQGERTLTAHALVARLGEACGARWIALSLEERRADRATRRAALRWTAGATRGGSIDLRVSLEGPRWRASVELRFVARREIDAQRGAVRSALTWLRAFVERVYAIEHAPSAVGPSLRDALEAASTHWRLTAHQRTVLQLVLEGRSNKELASTLGCTLSNIESRVGDLLRKAKVRSRSGLIAACLGLATSAS